MYVSGSIVIFLFTLNLLFRIVIHIFSFCNSNEPDFSFICNLHKMIEPEMESSGEFREEEIVIGLYGIPQFGTAVERLQDEMRNLLRVLKNAWNESDERQAIILAMTFHVKFLLIHPFSDGNGRASRAIFSGIMSKNHFPKIIIPTCESTR